MNDKKIIIQKNAKNYLGKRGYSLIKSKFDYITLKKCKQDLTVRPYINQDYGPASTCFSLYLESPNKLYLPKHYGIEHFGEPEQIKMYKGDNIQLDFTGSLRDKQKDVIKVFMDSCKEGPLTIKTKGGIISVGCGFGKTVMALYIITQLNKKTIIIVHKEFLMNQWMERIQQFIPNAKIGKIQGSIIDIENKDIVLAMLQSISMKNYDNSIFDSFGFSIYDECHHIGAEVFSKALPKINTYISLGLSATPTRADGLTKVFTSYLGPIIFKGKNSNDKKVLVNIINYHENNPEYNKDEVTSFGKICVPRMINNIVNNINRNNLIIYLARKLVDKNKQVIILSDRRNQLSYLYGIIKNFTNVGYYIGGMKQKDLDISENANVILGTFPMSSEGLDIPSLDAAIFASPKSSIEQSIGRITRKNHDEIPIAYDIVDCFSIFPNQFKKRERVYKKLKYIINQGDLLVKNKLTDSTIEYFLDHELNKKNKNKNIECLIQEE